MEDLEAIATYDIADGAPVLDVDYDYKGRVEWWRYELLSRDGLPAGVEVGDSFQVRVRHDDSQGLMDVLFIPNASITKAKIKTVDRNWPKEPDDYDDPEQLERYTKELEKYFHISD